MRPLKIMFKDRPEDF